MFRINSFLDVENTIDYSSGNYYILDNSYYPPASDAVNFLLDPNVNTIVKSPFESFNGFRISSSLFQKVYYGVSSSFDFTTPLRAVKVKDSFVCLDDFYKITAPLECFERFQIDNPYEFLDNAALLIQRSLEIFTNGAVIKKSYNFLTPYTITVLNSLSANDIYIDRTLITNSLDVIDGYIDRTVINSFLNITDSYINNVSAFLEPLNDCKNIVTFELSVLEDFADSVSVSRAFEFLQDSKTTPSFSITMTK